MRKKIDLIRTCYRVVVTIPNDVVDYKQWAVFWMIYLGFFANYPKMESYQGCTADRAEESERLVELALPMAEIPDINYMSSEHTT